MMRVVGRVGVFAAAIAMVAASSAFAVNPRLGTPDPTAIATPEHIGPRTFTGADFEAGSGYNLGTLSGGVSGGWACFGSANSGTPVGPRCPGTAQGGGTGNHINLDGSLSGVVNKGNGSNQGLFLTQNLQFPNSTNVGVFAPDFKDFFAGTYNVDIRIDDFEGADYQIVPQSPTAGLVATRVIFAYTGYIYALHDADGPGPGTGFVFSSIGQWTHDVWNTVQISFDWANGLFTVSMGPDKDNLVDLATLPTTGLAQQVDEMVLFSNNYQNTGSGSVSGDPRGPGAYIDNLVAKPEPGTLAMLGIGALLALRRRSR